MAVPQPEHHVEQAAAADEVARLKAELATAQQDLATEKQQFEAEKQAKDRPPPELYPIDHAEQDVMEEHAKNTHESVDLDDAEKQAASAATDETLAEDALRKAEEALMRNGPLSPTAALQFRESVSDADHKVSDSKAALENTEKLVTAVQHIESKTELVAQSWPGIVQQYGASQSSEAEHAAEESRRKRLNKKKRGLSTQMADLRLEEEDIERRQSELDSQAAAAAAAAQVRG